MAPFPDPIFVLALVLACLCRGVRGQRVQHLLHPGFSFIVKTPSCHCKHFIESIYITLTGGHPRLLAHPRSRDEHLLLHHGHLHAPKVLFFIVIVIISIIMIMILRSTYTLPRLCPLLHHHHRQHHHHYEHIHSPDVVASSYFLHLSQLQAVP